MESLLIENCNVLNPAGENAARSILVEGGKIVKLSEHPTQEAPEGTTTIDAGGGTVLPGLIDTHCHMVALGSMRRILDLTGTSNVTALRLRLFSKVNRAPPGEWVMGRGWDQEGFTERRYPSRDDIDDLTRDNPVILTRVCGHVILLNSVAMNRLGLDDGAVSEGGRVFDRDSKGRLTGIIRERAVEEALDGIRPWSDEVIEADILAGEYEAARNGLTSLHCILSFNYEQELRVFLSLHRRGKLALRYRIYLPAAALKRLEEPEFRRPGSDGMLKILGVKVFADGSLGARTAALREPYSDDPTNSGVLRYTQEELEEILGTADSLGKQVLIHAIGDAAVSQAIGAIESVTLGKNERRHRIEHCSLCTGEMMKRLKEAGIGVGVQPHFVVSDTWALERLGEARIRWLYPLKSLLKNGVTASGGSDAPVEPISPILGMWAAMVGAGYSPEERLDIHEALRLYTENAASNGFDEGNLGEIREGFLADLTILDSDIRDIHPAMLRKVGVATTVVNGRVAYSYEGVS
jgi:predicted amidohydrolase YtcJ